MELRPGSYRRLSAQVQMDTEPVMTTRYVICTKYANVSHRCSVCLEFSVSPSETPGLGRAGRPYNVPILQCPTASRRLPGHSEGREA